MGRGCGAPGAFHITGTSRTAAASVAPSHSDGPAQAPIALRYMKENINRAATADLRTALAAEASAMVRAMKTEDHKGAARAFLEKRKPSFNGS